MTDRPRHNPRALVELSQAGYYTDYRGTYWTLRAQRDESEWAPVYHVDPEREGVTI